jgi:hypothetical protein
MMEGYNEAVKMLASKIKDAINYCVMESDITNAEVLGVLAHMMFLVNQEAAKDAESNSRTD